MKSSKRSSWSRNNRCISVTMSSRQTCLPRAIERRNHRALHPLVVHQVVEIAPGKVVVSYQWCAFRRWLLLIVSEAPRRSCSLIRWALILKRTSQASCVSPLPTIPRLAAACFLRKSANRTTFITLRRRPSSSRPRIASANRRPRWSSADKLYQWFLKCAKLISSTHQPVSNRSWRPTRLTTSTFPSTRIEFLSLIISNINISSRMSQTALLKRS